MAIDFSTLVMGPCAAVFGRDVLYTPVVSAPGAMPFTVRGIFDAEHQAVEPDYRGDGDQFTAMAVTSQGPVLAVRLRDMPQEPLAGDAVCIGGVTYQVWDVVPDGQGKVDLMLRLA